MLRSAGVLRRSTGCGRMEQARLASALSGRDGKGGRPLWGLIADTHFKEQGLEAIEEAADWAVDVFRERDVSHVFMLGDMLNTREMVHVGAQSAAVSWVRRLVDEFGKNRARREGEGEGEREEGGVHVLLGNHDMHLRHSRGVTSLDALALPPLEEANLRLYKEPQLIHPDGFPVLMVPYHHDQLEVAELLKKHKEEDPEVAAATVAMAHVAVHGALQNMAWGTTFTGPLGMSAFNGLKRSFSGHFHSHQTLPQGMSEPVPAGQPLPGSLTYVGSPLQFNFGDLGDKQRGVILYDPVADVFEHVAYPKAVRFTQVSEEEVMAAASSAEKMKAMKERVGGLMVSLAASKEDSRWANDAASLRRFEDAKNVLVRAGVRSVRKPFRKASGPTPRVRTEAEELNRRMHHKKRVTYRFGDFVVPFVEKKMKTLEKGSRVTESHRDQLVALGSVVIGEGESDKTGSKKSAGEGEIFHADVESIEMENFMGVKEEQELHLGSFPDGVWYIQGRNGSGKSTVLEALCWCLFGQFLRSEMKADFAINDEVGKNARVAVTFSNGVRVERFRKNSALGGNGFVVTKNGTQLLNIDKGTRDAAQAALDQLLGTNFATYSKTVVLAEETARGFVQATPAARRQIIEDLLGFGEFEQYLKLLREKMKELKKQIAGFDLEIHTVGHARQQAEAAMEELERRRQTVEKRVAECREAVAEAEKAVAKLTEVEDSEEAAKVASVAAHEKSLAKAEMALEWKQLNDEWNGLLRKAELSTEEAGSRARSFADALASVSASRAAASADPVRQQLDSMDSGLSEHKKEIGDVARQLVEALGNEAEKIVVPGMEPLVRSSEGNEGQLSYLRQLLQEGGDDVQMKEREEELRVEVADAESLAKAREAEFADLQLRHGEATSKWLREKQIRNVDALEAASDRISPAARNELQAKLSAAREALDAHRKEKAIEAVVSSNPLTEAKVEAASVEEMLRGIVEQLSARKEEAERASEKMKDLEEDREAKVEEEALHSFWEDGFGRKGNSMRDFVFEENLLELNMTLDDVMSRLCDDGVDVHDLKTNLTSDFAFSGKDYGKRSSGERKRTALALFFSLVQLTRSRSRHQTELIMLDECFDALDASGQDSAHRIVEELHRGFGDGGGIKKAFVITHAQNANIGHKLKVEKGPNGTQFFPEVNVFAQ